MIRIVADSSCDISQTEAKQLNLEIIPLPINFGNDTYMDGINIYAEQFYEMLANSPELPTTSQPNPLEFIERFEEVKKSGDSILIITLSSKISGAYNSACLYKRESNYSEIEVVDSTGTVGFMQILVLEALKQRDEGKMNVHELATYLNNFKKRIRLIAMIDTLEYLHKGGRLSGTARLFGTFLNIKPLISIIDGEIRMIDKKIGATKAVEQLVSNFANYDVDFSFPMIFGYTATQDRMNLLIEKMKTTYNLGEYKISSLGPTVGVHIGPGAGYVAFVVKDKK